MRWVVLSCLMLTGCPEDENDSQSEAETGDCQVSSCGPSTPCDEPELVPLPTGTFSANSGGAATVFGSVDGDVTASVDMDANTVVLQFTRATGEVVEVTYGIDELGDAPFY